MKTTGSKNIKDYKENTRILYCHKCRQTLQWEAIISEFSDSGEYVCLEHSPNETSNWYKVTDIIVLDTLKNKHSKNIEEFIRKEREQFAREEVMFQKYDKMSYEQHEAEAIEKECRAYEQLTKVTEVVRLSDYTVFTKNEYEQKFYHINKESFLTEYFTFREVQKFIDQGLFMILKHSNDPMWQKPLCTTSSFVDTLTEKY